MSDTQDRMRIASYNIRKAVGTDRRRDPHRILDIIGDLKADVVVLQEADKRLGDRPGVLPVDEIAARCGLESIGAAANGVSTGWHGNAILARPGTSVQNIERMHLPGIEPRGAVVADLVVRGMDLRVVALHLGLIRMSRRRQLSHLLDTLHTMRVMPTVVAGDFNEWSLKVGLGRLASHFSIHAPGKSFHAKRPVAALDRIALNDLLALQDAGVVDTPLTRVASDHLPIWMEFSRIGADDPSS
jgi:endonuclease/exonuclease/phosphatase family metal-dependent hydrolase